MFHAAKLLMLHVQPLLQLDHQLPLVVKLLYEHGIFFFDRLVV